jgi:subtilisin
MRKKFLLSSLLILSVILALEIIAKPATQAQGVGHEKVLIGFKKFPGKSEKALVEKVGGKIKYTYHLIPVIAASVPSPAIKGLRHNPNVTYIERDGDVFIDSELTDSWGVDRIDAEVAWVYPGTGNKGAGIHVAVIDTGIDRDHPDLAINIAGGVNFVSGKGKDKTPDPEAWDDDHGHGTHCAGIVAADDNGSGVVGVAPDASLYGIKILDSKGRGKASDFIAGLEWAVSGPDTIYGTPDDTEIVSMSLRMGDTETDSVTGACDAAYKKGLLIVKSAGNTGHTVSKSVTSPGQHPAVLAVSAIDESDNIASFSAQSPDVELAAPGVNVYSTNKNGGYTYMDGTSMACPHVSGSAALAWATGNYVSGAGVRLQLRKTAEWLGGLNSDQQGYGLVNPEAALASPEPGILFLLDRDKSGYQINETAVLSAVVSDEQGNFVTGLPTSAFMTTLYEVDDPDQTPIPRLVTFLETSIAGVYEGELSFSDLATGEYLEIVYRAEVEVTELRGLSEADDVTFLVYDLSGSLSVLIETDKTFPACYTVGDTINVQVTVKDAENYIIPGADVHVEYNSPSGRYYLRDEITDGDGVARFKYKTKPPDGTGNGLVRVWASKSGYPSTLDEKVVCVN